jgi:hypothetical protein
MTISCLFTPAYTDPLINYQQRLAESTYSFNLSLLAYAYTQEALSAVQLLHCGFAPLHRILRLRQLLHATEHVLSTRYFDRFK